MCTGDMQEFPVPPFRPHRLLAGPHAQTLAAAYLPSSHGADTAKQHYVRLDDGDQIVLHDDCASDWQPRDQVVLLMHGLSGCHQSGYMRRIATKLTARGVRVFRMDHRGCGAGAGLARLPYHAGASSDLSAAIRSIERLAPRSELSIVGFSLSGNILLKYLGERSTDVPPSVRSAVAVCPPVDLHAANERMEKFACRIYNRHFVKLLLRQVRAKERRRDDASRIALRGRIKCLRDFDDQYTAPLSGFAGVEDYYTRASAQPLLSAIRVPTMILAAKDDPMIPIDSITSASLAQDISLITTERGGHLGFYARKNGEPDRYWMDWRVVDWVKR